MTTPDNTTHDESETLQAPRDPQLADVTSWAASLYVAILNTIDVQDLDEDARALWDAGSTLLAKAFEAGETTSPSERRLGYTLVLSALFTSTGAMECAGRIIAQFVKYDPAVRKLNHALITKEQIDAQDEQREAFIARAIAEPAVRTRLWVEALEEAKKDVWGIVFKLVDEAERERKSGDRPSPTA